MLDNITTIHFRFLEIKDDDSLVLKIDKDHKDGYYKFLIQKEELNKILDTTDKKSSLYEYFALNINRYFLEFLMFEVNLNSVYIASIRIDDTAEEFSYLEAQYMDDLILDNDIKTLYGEELGMVSDFDFYPYGLK